VPTACGVIPIVLPILARTDFRFGVEDFILAVLAHSRNAIFPLGDFISEVAVADFGATAGDALPTNHSVSRVREQSENGLREVRWKWHGVYYREAQRAGQAETWIST
jgi:hypothetical protein